MYQFHALIERFAEMGEKTNWYYVMMPMDVIEDIKSISKKSLRVKGTIDAAHIVQLALWPVGDGQYILPLNGPLRKQLHKDVGMQVHCQIAFDDSAISLNPDLLECLQDDAIAMERFFNLNKSFQNNFSRIVNDAKTIETQTKRIAKILRTLHAGKTIDEMMVEYRKKDV
jgi:Domain of unknown function (DUF1905)/Bacteriocin-protection, YdeI or OmpD-Associated